MLNQIVYTRCLPYRDLLRGGQIVQGDGFGVFSLSPQVLDSCSLEELTLINNRLAIPNAAKEFTAPGLFNSYEYIILPSGKGALTYEVARPLCEEPRKNGRLNRSGTFIKQCLVGDFSRKAIDLIESDVWDAYKTPENDYYMDNIPNPEPPMLPLINEAAVKAGIDDTLIDQFVHDGREMLLHKALGFVLRELDKPDSERKVLLIKDEPQNVNLWVLAIIRALPEKFANKVSFSTNVSNLTADINNALYYYTDKADKIYTFQNLALELTRHPYCMIVGYHPEDVFSANIRQTTDCNFYTIDGVTYSTTIPDSYNMSAEFCGAAAFLSEEYQKFYDLKFAYMPLNVTSTEIDETFVAYSYIVSGDVNEWKYSEAITQLQKLTQVDTFNDFESNNNLVNKILPYISENFKYEIQHAFGLSVALWRYAEKTQTCAKVIEVLSKGIREQLINDKGIQSTWIQLRRIKGEKVYKSVLMTLFADDELPDIYKHFSYCSKQDVSTVFEMFCEKLMLSGEGQRSLLEDKEKFNFAYYAINAVRNSPSHASRCLRKVNGDPVLYVRLVGEISKDVDEDSEEDDKWWPVVAESAGESVISLCTYLCDETTAEFAQIEQLLCHSIQVNKVYDEDICKAFIELKRKMHGDDRVGGQLFRSLIAYSDLRDYPRLIYYTRKVGFNPNVERKLFRSLDNKLGLPDVAYDNTDILVDMENWARSLGTVSIYSACYRLQRRIRYENNDVGILKALREFAEYRIPYRDEYIQTEWYDSLINKALSFKSGSLHLMMTCLFKYEGEEQHKQYIRSYICDVLKKTDKKNLINVMLSMCNSLCVDCSIPGYSGQEVDVIQRQIEYALTYELIPYYSKSIIKKVEKNKDFDDITKRKLISILTVVSERNPDKEHKGIFGSLFRRRK